MSRVEAGSTYNRSTYNSLTDHHLTDYYSRSRPRQHLRQSGLIRRDGEILSEASLYADSLKRDQKRQAKETILRSLQSRKDDLARNHQALCLRTIEEIEKIERVRRIRSGKRNGCAADLIDCAIVPASICHRPISASLMNGKQTSGNLCCSNKDLIRSRRARSAGVCGRRGCCHDEDDDSQCNGHSDGQRASGDRTNGLSPYLLSQTPSDYLPALPARRRPKKRKLRPRDKRERKNTQPLKPKQTGGVEDDWRVAMVTMKYYGDNLRLENDQADPRVDVLVEQQHCGGNTLYVFKDRILPGTEFSFPSYRHPGYPFSLTIYVNGRHDSRLSVCCEYKHKINARLGGKGGHFAVVGVKRGMPCHSCMMKFNQKSRKKNKGRRDLNKGLNDDSSDSREDNDEETAMSRFYPDHRNRLRIPVDDEENDRDEEYGKELNKRTADAQSPDFDQRPRTSSAKKSRDPYDHYMYDIQVPVEDEDNGNNNNAGGVGHARRESASREQQMKSPSKASQQAESSSESSDSSSDSSESSEDEEGEEEHDVYSKGSGCTEDIENVKPKSSRSQRESNPEDEPASESGS